MTNNAPDAQKVPGACPDLDGLEVFAADRRRACAGQTLSVKRLTGFCLLVRREVLDHIGSFDERFGMGFFDDDDLCRRASCLAIDPEDPACVIGAALLAPANGVVRRPPESATQLQPVFVIPGWRRRRVATALVAEVLRRLWNAGKEVLISGCSDYNAASKRWHLAFGVTEERCYYAWRPLFYWVRNEISRRAYLEKTRGITFESLDLANLERWFIALADKLDALEREEPWFG